jgi:murein L,D-transpeptidase YcbB/YkuD
MGRKKVLAALGIVALLTAALTWVAAGFRLRVDSDFQLDRITTAHPEVRIPDGVRLDVRAFYDNREQAPAWIVERSLSPKVAPALGVLETAVFHGLNPADYAAPSLRTHRDRLESAAADDRGSSEYLTALVDFDVQLTSALLSLGHDVAVGRIPPADLNPQWRSRRDPPNLPRTLSRAIETDLAGWLDSIAPRHTEYHALKSVLADPDRLSGVARDDAAAVVAANMERWRWVPDDFGARHFYVNIPSYTLIARKDGADDLAMRVVVGKSQTNETPILSSRISGLVFSPSWNIPASIVARETVPAFLRDPGYLDRLGIDALRSTSNGYVRVDAAALTGSSAGELKRMLYRQRPGPKNALGQVKFPFPNDHDVYLHDTPADEAFGRVTRALSHGCVRLERPDLLAAYSLAEANESTEKAGWTDARIKRAMASGREQFVKLPSAINVHLVYFTASVNGAGELVFLPDIYRLDVRQIEAGGPIRLPGSGGGRLSLLRQPYR